MPQNVNQLRELRLNAMVQAYEMQYEQPKLHEIGFDDRFGMLLEAEVAACNSRKLPQLLKVALCPILACMVIASSLEAGASGRTRRPDDPCATHLALTGMRFTRSCALADFGSVTVSTPFLKEASTLSDSTSAGSARRRSKRP